jgi:GT2 family glycosyltransferase/glycosyltransferase involved in cell wall biosynthesis
MLENTKISIILPVFNAPDDLKRCLDSVRSHTESSCQVIIINDGSTDPRIPGIIEEFRTAFPSCLALANPENLGFVKTCNRGFQKASGTDVILLNSDTVVTSGWIRKLSKAAYSLPNVATVTPLTNNGTVCSIPTWLEENPLPEGFSIDEIAELVETSSLKAYPSIPTAIGFCMYITRDALEDVGLFNDIDFGKGYGEENDWCYRATSLGYCHIVDDATFVYHAGSKSFGTEKAKIVELNTQKMDFLHPSYHQDVADFIREKSLEDVLENIRLRLKISNFIAKRPVCFLLHNPINVAKGRSIGGTELYCQELKSFIEYSRPVYVIYPDREKLALNVDIHYQGETESFHFKCSALRFEHERFLRRNATYHQLLLSIFSILQPSMLHIHHLLGFSLLDTSAVIKSLRIPIILSIHDFYFICPSFRLVDSQQRFCADYKSEDYCASCIPKLFGQGTELKARWHQAVSELFSSVSLLLTPSTSCADFYKQEYPNFADKFFVVPHGLNRSFVEQLRTVRQQPEVPKSKLCVGFVGAIDKFKGSEIICQIIESFWNDSRLRDQVHFKIVGILDVDLPKNCKNYTITGPYHRMNLSQHLAEIDLAVFPFQAAETYCLTVDEVLVSGIPIVVTPIGPVPERVTRSRAGWVTEDFKASSIQQVILNCLNSPSSLAEKAERAKQYEPLDFQSVCEIYLKYYEKLEHEACKPSKARTASVVKTSSFNRLFLNAYETDIRTNETSPLASNVIVLDRKKIVGRFYFLKERFPGIWHYIRLKAFRMGVIK